MLGIAAGWLAMHPHVKVKYYEISSGSMEPTLQVGARVAVESSQTPQVGDIVVFHPPQGAVATNPVCGLIGQGLGSTQACGLSVPQESSATFTKRVVAGPGGVISIVDGHVVLNGTTENEPYIALCGDAARCDFPTPVTVPAGEYYLLGDNRGVSDDSRYWGPVPSSWIIGTVVRCSLFGSCHAAR
jgi:signal peptidase I